MSTEAQERHDRANHIAAQELGDIHSLKSNESFTRYYVPRLKKKQALVLAQMRDDPPEKCSHEEREIRRRIVKEYDAILRMMDEDANACDSQLKAPPPR